MPGLAPGIFLSIGAVMSSSISPLAPTDVPDMPAIAGVRLATAEAGIRYRGRTDVLLAVLDRGTAVAGVFTKSKCASAPVEWCRKLLKGGKARALVVNSGNANAFTGKTGKQSTALTAAIAAKAVGCKASEVFLASTGVIGEPLDATKFDGVLGVPEGADDPRVAGNLLQLLALDLVEVVALVAGAPADLGLDPEALAERPHLSLDHRIARLERAEGK